VHDFFYTFGSWYWLFVFRGELCDNRKTFTYLVDVGGRVIVNLYMLSFYIFYMRYTNRQSSSSSSSSHPWQSVWTVRWCSNFISKTNKSQPDFKILCCFASSVETSDRQIMKRCKSYTITWNGFAVSVVQYISF